MVVELEIVISQMMIQQMMMMMYKFHGEVLMMQMMVINVTMEIYELVTLFQKIYSVDQKTMKRIINCLLQFQVNQMKIYQMKAVISNYVKKLQNTPGIQHSNI